MEGKLCEAPASHAQRLFQVPVGRYSTVLHGIDGIYGPQPRPGL